MAVFAGLAVCVLAAMIRAPYFRAIAGPGYPLAPRNREEAARLSLFYVLANLVIWVLPMAAPGNSVLAQIVSFAVLVIAILIVFVDYVIVFEDMAFLPALRRSVQLFARRWITVIAIFVVIQLVYLGIYSLYDLYYRGADGVVHPSPAQSDPGGIVRGAVRRPGADLPLRADKTGRARLQDRDPGPQGTTSTVGAVVGASSGATRG